MEHTVKIAAVGDVLLGDPFYHIGSGVRSVIDKRGKDFIFAEVLDILRAHDVVVGNLECVLSDAELNPYLVSSFQYRGRQAFVDCLSRANFSVVNISNNHVLQHGPIAYLETISALESIGIKAIGRADGLQRQNPGRCLVQMEGMQIAFLGFCLYRDKFTKPIMSNLPDILNEIRTFSALADRVIVSLHWGIEYMTIPSPSQIDIAHMIIDAGACVILGHHPHVIQGIEEYKGAIVAYSLGNFVFSGWLHDSRSSMILSISLSSHGPIQFEAIPVWINDEWQPVPAANDTDRRIREEIAGRSRTLKDNPFLQEHDETGYLRLAGSVLDWRRRQLRMYILKHVWKQAPWVAVQLLARPMLRLLGG